MKNGRMAVPKAPAGFNSLICHPRRCLEKQF